MGEQQSGYTYVPIDPFAVDTQPGEGCIATEQQQPKVYGTLLESLPDNAVRMLIEQIDSSGTVTYGPAKFGSKGQAYTVTIDYINADTINFPVWISRTVSLADNSTVLVPLTGEIPQGQPQPIIPGSAIYTVSREKPEKIWDGYNVLFNVPVYVGIGLRVSATVEVIGASANISGIGVIGAEADAQKLRGSLVVQTLGVNGKSVAAALPIQSELNRTTAQSAIVAVGSIKALLYADETSVSPRVVGLYLPLAGGKPLVNALISELSKERPVWRRPCLVAPKPIGSSAVAVPTEPAVKTAAPAKTDSTVAAATKTAPTKATVKTGAAAKTDATVVAPPKAASARAAPAKTTESTVVAPPKSASANAAPTRSTLKTAAPAKTESTVAAPPKAAQATAAPPNAARATAAPANTPPESASSASATPAQR
jgi:hypothetical protein